MKILCFGDSNTYGFDPRSYFGGRYTADCRWVDILAGKSNWQLENAGQNGLSIPGDEYEITTYNKIFSKKTPDLLIIMLGSNDLLQGLSAKSTAARMLRFISKLTLEPDKIFLISPPAFKDGMWISDEKMLEHSAQLWQFYSELSLKTGVRFANAADWDIPLCYDGVHFTENGHKIFAENIYKMIIKIKEN